MKKLNALVADKDAAQAELDALYLRWEELSEAGRRGKKQR